MIRPGHPNRIYKITPTPTIANGAVIAFEVITNLYYNEFKSFEIKLTIFPIYCYFKELIYFNEINFKFSIKIN